MIHGPHFPLPDRLREFRQHVHCFAQKEIAPYAAEIDAANAFPYALWSQLGRADLLGLTIDSCYGGTAQGYWAHVIAMEEISRASGAVGLSYAAHSNLCLHQIHHFACPEQKDKFLPPLIQGKYVGALAMSESGAGSDVMSMRLTATPHGEGDYVLDGQKMWITNAPMADVIVVYARTVGKEGSPITAFLVEKTMPGFSAAPTLHKFGMRGSDTSALNFNRVLIPKANILGRVGQGASILKTGLNYERLILSAGPVGIMQACLDVVIPYIHERRQFDRAIGSFQLIAAKVADMYNALTASRAYLYLLANNADQGCLSHKDAASIFLLTAEHATQVALQAMQCFGGNGYIDAFPLGRFLRDAKLYEIGGGTTEMRRITIGKALLKEHEKNLIEAEY